jgi:hypothetical protein
MGREFGLVVRAADWHAGNQGSNPRQERPLYIWMYTPALRVRFGGDIALYSLHLFIYLFVPNL